MPQVYEYLVRVGPDGTIKGCHRKDYLSLDPVIEGVAHPVDASEIEAFLASQHPPVAEP